MRQWRTFRRPLQGTGISTTFTAEGSRSSNSCLAIDKGGAQRSKPRDFTPIRSLDFKSIRGENRRRITMRVKALYILLVVGLLLASCAPPATPTEAPPT